MRFASRSIYLGAAVAALCSACGGSSAPAVAPSITVQPGALLAAAPGTPATMSVTVSGSEPLSYQWQRDGVDIPGATGASYQLPAPRFADSGHKWHVVVRNAAGTVTSGDVTLNVSGIALVAGAVGESAYTDGAAGAARFVAPYGLVFNSKGELFVSDQYAYAIRKISTEGSVTTFAGNGASGNADGTATAASFGGPVGIAVDAADNLFVTDADALTVRKITPAAVVSTVASIPQGPNDGRSWRTFSPTGIAVDGGGNLYVANGLGTRKIAPQGATTIIEGVDVNTSALWGTSSMRWRGLAADASGKLLVANLWGGISVVQPGGALTPLAGGSDVNSALPGNADGTGAAAKFNFPGGIALDKQGNLYVADVGNGTIRKVTPAGVVTTVAGVAGATDVQLGALPGHLAGLRSVVVAPDGGLYATVANVVVQIRF